MANSNKKSTPAKKAPAKKAPAKKAPAKKATAKKAPAKKAPAKKATAKKNIATDLHEQAHKIQAEAIAPVISDVIAKAGEFIGSQVPDKIEIDTVKAKGFFAKLLGKFKK